ncbi:PAS domain-containing protein [Pseudoroseomonas wenyumeiae]
MDGDALAGGRGFFSQVDQPGATWFERYVHPDDQAMVRAAVQEAIRTKGVYELEHRTTRDDGSEGGSTPAPCRCWTRPGRSGNGSAPPAT